MSVKNRPVYKLKLKPTLREVVIREPEIADMEAAGKVAAKGNRGPVTGIALQQELIKRILVQVDGKNLSIADREAINSLLSLKEYMQIMGVVQKLIGEDDEGNEPEIEISSNPA